MTNIGSSNGTLNKPIKSATSAKGKSRKDNILDKLVLIIYGMRNSRHAQWKRCGQLIGSYYSISPKLSLLTAIVDG